MRTLARVAIGLVAAVAIGLVGLALALPAIVDGAELRAMLDRIARETIGRSLEYGEVSIGILPPRLEVNDLVIGGASELAPPVLEANGAALALAWRPLFSGKAVFDSLVIDSAELRMVRSSDGVDWMVAGIPAAPGTSARGDSPISLRRVLLRDSRIVFDDRVLAPAVRWQVDEVRLDASGGGAGDPIDFALAGELASGGSLRGEGRIDDSGATKVEIEIEDFAFVPLASYVEALDRADGAGSVELDLVRAASGELDLGLSLQSEDVDVASGDTTVTGAVALTATLELRGGILEGPYSVDLTGATLDVADGAVHKAAGEPASLEGRVRIDDAGTSIDFHLQLRNLAARGRLRTAPGLRLELVAPAFALDGWGATIPALADYAPKGELVIERLVYTGEPQRLNGIAELRSLLLDRGDGTPPLRVSGFIDAQGDALAVRDMAATAGPARFLIEGGVEDLFGASYVSVRLNNPEPIESNFVFSLVDALRDSIFGALVLDFDLGLPVGGSATDRPVLERIAGNFGFQIGGDEAGGRLQGVSLLRQMFDRFGALGYAALLALPAKHGKSLDDYYSEKFSVASGSFRIADGHAITEDLRIVHEKYRANLRGGLQLTDLSLDMRGEIVIGSELDAVLSGAEVGRERTIPLARVGGTVTDPTIALRDEDVTRFLAQYALRSDGKLGRKIDKALGAGASDLLRGVLGGRRR